MLKSIYIIFSSKFKSLKYNKYLPAGLLLWTSSLFHCSCPRSCYHSLLLSLYISPLRMSTFFFALVVISAMWIFHFPFCWSCLCPRCLWFVTSFIFFSPILIFGAAFSLFLAIYRNERVSIPHLSSLKNICLKIYIYTCQNDRIIKFF